MSPADSRPTLHRDVLLAAAALVPVALLAAVEDLTARPSLVVAAFAGAVVVMACGRRFPPPIRVVLVVAALQRLLAVGVAPTLSDDVWRYLWEGRVALAGISPWQHPPEDPLLEPLRSFEWNQVAHRDVPSIYPPLAVAGFSIAAASARPLLAWKLLVGLADFGVCLLLLMWLRRRQLPLGRVVWYAWNPLPILEGPGMGHLDSMAVLLVLGGLLALHARPERSVLAGSLLACGALAKLAPVVVLPLWARSSRRPWVVIVVCLAIGLLGALPMLIGGLPPALSTYAVSWEFDGPLYEPLWRVVEALDVADAIKALFDHVEHTLGRYELLDPLYPWVYPQLLAKAVLVLVAGGAFVRILGDRDPLQATGRLFGVLLLCSATLYPWYLLWVLPFAVIFERRGWLTAAATSWICYLAQLGVAPLWPWIWALQWVPPLAARLSERSWSSTP